MHMDDHNRHYWPILIAFFVLINGIQSYSNTSLTSCEYRNEWCDRIKIPRTLMLGAFYPNEELLESLLPAINLALRDISRNKCVLTQYKLNISHRNTGCKASRGMKAFFSMMNDSPKKVALFGGACTSVNEPIAAAARYFNMTQLSYHETHPKFSTGNSSERYGTFYRIIPGASNEQMAQISLVKRFNWTRFGLVVQQDEDRFSLPNERYVSVLRSEHNFTTASTGFSSKEPNYAFALSKLKNDSVRIIIGDFNMTQAGAAIFCEAYKQNLTGALYVWLLSGQHTRISASQAAGNYCKPDELDAALQGHFIFEFAPMRNDTSGGGKIVKDKNMYITQYELECKKFAKCQPDNPFHAYAYDGIWALALAMDEAIKLQWQTEDTFFDPNVDLLDHSKWAKRLTSALTNLTFEGITGRIQFSNTTNERLGRIRILQYQYGNYVHVGEYDAATMHLVLENEKDLFFWTADGLPPRDNVNHRYEMEYIDFSIFCVMCTLTGIGIIMALGFLSVNVYFRSHRFIKMSSPNMNNLIIAGSILTYISVVLLGIDTLNSDISTYNVLCTAKVATLSVGFSLAFGSMFSKTWRVHSIFTNIKLNKKAIKDYKLFLLVFVLFLIDTIIIAVWASVSPLHRRVRPLHNDTRPELVITPEREYCDGENKSIFQGLLFGYKGILLILGCFLAWETRHVNVPALNDSKYIGMSVYNVVLMCALGVAIVFILETKANASYVLISLFIIFCTTLTLCLVFVPKIVELVRNPKGIAGGDRRYRAAMMKSVGTERKMSEAEMETHKDQLVRSEQDNQVWRKMLEEKNKDIAEMLKRLQEFGEVTLELSSLPKENTSQFSHSSVPDDPFGGVYLGPPGPSLAQKQQQLEQQAPTLDEMSEKTSLIQRRIMGSFRDKLSKLRTSISRSSMPASWTLDNASATDPSTNVHRSTSMYQSLRELHSNMNESEITSSSIPNPTTDMKSRSTSTSSEYTDDEDDAKRSRYVDPILDTQDSNSTPQRTLHSIRESCLINEALSSCESTIGTDEDELLDEEDDENEAHEEDALL